MADTSGLPPEGWYPDRPNATRLRHWSGTGWTNEFRPIEPPAPAATSAPVSPVRETTDPARSRRELRAQVGALVQGEPDLAPGAHTSAVPVIAERSVPVEAAAVRPPTLSLRPEATTVAPRAVAAEPVLERAVEPVVVAEIDDTPEIDPSLSSSDRARVAGGYVPTRQPWQESFAPTARTGSSQTLAGWLFATSPLWVGAMLIAATTVLSIVNPYLVQGGLLLVAFGMTFLLARQDTSNLRRAGYRAPSTWWVLLPFGYFFVRLLRVGMRGMGMLVTYFLSVVAFSGLVFALVGHPGLFTTLTPSIPAETSSVPTPVATLSAQERANLLTADGIEAKLRLDLASTWDVGAVDCVPFASLDPGVTTTCVVVLDGETYNAGLQVTPDEPDEAFVLTGMLPAPS